MLVYKAPLLSVVVFMRVPPSWLRVGGKDELEKPLLGDSKLSENISVGSCAISVRTGHIIACILHGLNFVGVVAAIISVPLAAGQYQLTRQATVWLPAGNNNNTTKVMGFSIHRSHLDASTLNLKILMPIFLILAILDHMFVLISEPLNIRFLSEIPIVERGARLRLVEYSISASLMTLAIAVEAGINDVYTLVCIFVLMSSCMLNGLIADLVSKSSLPLAWFSHVIGWITCLAAYAPIIAVFYDSVKQSDVRPPEFVFWLVWNEFFLFCGFGLIQTWYLYKLKNKPSRLRVNTELSFIAFSFVAKTFLVWIVLGPVLRDQSS